MFQYFLLLSRLHGIQAFIKAVSNLFQYFLLLSCLHGIEACLKTVSNLFLYFLLLSRLHGIQAYIKAVSNLFQYFMLLFKGTVQPELRGDKIGINPTAMKICVAGKCRLPCPKGHHHERSINILGGCSTF